jgi:hypothetical protein
MNNTIIPNIKSKIYTIRGLQVILDSDLSKLYGVKAIRLREQVKRNIKRFPSDFMLKLNDDEIDFMVSQNAIPSRKHLGGHHPYAFTEQGVANLSSILNSDKAVEINIKIIRAFISMRKLIASSTGLFPRVENIECRLLEHDKKLDNLFEAIQGKILPNKGIFFEGQVFDAYKFISEIIKNAKKSIILIDNYIDESVLVLFSKRGKNINVKIYTKQIMLDLQKFNSQYPSIEIKQFAKSHDRFLIIDEKIVYHFGASLKDLGKKWFAFSRLDKESVNIMNKIK